MDKFKAERTDYLTGGFAYFSMLNYNGSSDKEQKMRFSEKLYLSRSMEGKDKKIRSKLNSGAGLIGVYCIAVPSFGSDPLEIYNASELKQRWYRRSPLLIVGLAGGRKEACYLSANILSEIYEKQGDYDSRRFFGEEMGV